MKIPQEIAAVAALAHDRTVNVFLAQTALCEKGAFIPGRQEFAPMTRVIQIAETRFQNVEDLRLRPIHREISGRQQHVIKESRA